MLAIVAGTASADTWYYNENRDEMRDTSRPFVFSFSDKIDGEPDQAMILVVQCADHDSLMLLSNEDGFELDPAHNPPSLLRFDKESAIDTLVEWASAKREGVYFRFKDVSLLMLEHAILRLQAQIDGYGAPIMQFELLDFNRVWAKCPLRPDETSQ